MAPPNDLSSVDSARIALHVMCQLRLVSLLKTPAHFTDEVHTAYLLGRSRDSFSRRNDIVAKSMPEYGPIRDQRGAERCDKLDTSHLMGRAGLRRGKWATFPDVVFRL